MKSFFTGLAVVAIHLTTAVAAPTGKPAIRPNIVLIFADDLGVNDLACYGRSEHRTPHLDRLASQGMRFTNAYCAQPICSPSRAALMTGQCPARLNLTNYLPGRADAPSQRVLQPQIEGQLPLEEVTIAELLREAGYATGLFGKWHLGGKDFGPAAQGFDVVVSPPANTEPSVETGGKGEFLISDAAEKFIEEHRDEPFLCYVPHNNPHIPLAAAPELIETNRDAFHPVYAAMIETLDKSVGRLMHKIKDLGLADKTIFIFTSDNGGLHVLESPGTPATHNTPFRAGKGYIYEGGLREPLIVRWPGVVAPGSVCDAPVVITDLVPTVLEAAGVDPAKTVGPLDGENFMPLLRGEPMSERALFWHFPNYTNQGGRPAGAVREGDWKLIEQYEDGGIELYNLKDDVGETKNLAAAEPARVDALLSKLKAWRHRVGAKMPRPNPEFDAALHHRLYVDRDPSKLVSLSTAAETDPLLAEWRAAMNAAIQGRRPVVTPQSDIRLHAKNARVHGENLRYEPEPYKNVIGYWTVASDWAEWQFDVAPIGDSEDKVERYEVEVQYGCGEGSGGADVSIVVDDIALDFTVRETGHFQHMILQTVGEVELKRGAHTLQIRAKSKPGVAVMDVRRIVLRPVE